MTTSFNGHGEYPNDPPPRNDPPKVLVLCGSPRREGNSWLLAEAFAEGSLEAGHDCELVYLSDYVKELLRDCRKCRRPDGSCSIDDRFEELFFEKALPADAWIYATPLWWYGTSALLKNFFDRIFCYISPAMYSGLVPTKTGDKVLEELPGKRGAVLMSAEETNFGGRLAVLTQIQECCRYMHHPFVGFITGVGTSRNDVKADPSRPLDAARDMGRRLFEIRETNYDLVIPRPKKLWEGQDHYPAIWR